jgi:hypothetical protein
MKKQKARRQLDFTSIVRKDKTLKHISQPSDGENHAAKQGLRLFVVDVCNIANEMWDFIC